MGFGGLGFRAVQGLGFAVSGSPKLHEALEPRGAHRPRNPPGRGSRGLLDLRFIRQLGVRGLGIRMMRVRIRDLARMRI